MENTTYEPIPDNLNEPADKGDIYLLRREINERFAVLPTKEDFSQLLTAVDALTKQVGTYNAERSAETFRLERIENWIKEASKSLRVPFEL